jgi:hypothetical protein
MHAVNTCGVPRRVVCLCVCVLAGAAAIKYGSLVFELPFQPNPAVALTLVLGTPAAYSLFLLTKGDGGEQQQ